MEENDPKERVNTYLQVLGPVLEKLRITFLNVINNHEDVSEFNEIIKELDNARQLINSTENMGIVVGIATYLIAPFPLTGDPERDLGQVASKLSDMDPN